MKKERAYRRDFAEQLQLQLPNDVVTVCCDGCLRTFDKTTNNVLPYTLQPHHTLYISGTVSHLTSPQLQRSLFFGIASKLTLFPIISFLTVFGLYRVVQKGDTRETIWVSAFLDHPVVLYSTPCTVYARWRRITTFQQTLWNFIV